MSVEIFLAALMEIRLAADKQTDTHWVIQCSIARVASRGKNGIEPRLVSMHRHQPRRGQKPDRAEIHFTAFRTQPVVHNVSAYSPTRRDV